MKTSMTQRLAAEFLGSLILTFTAISPTILSYNALGSSVAMAVFMDAIAVGFVLFVLIEILEPVSYCHINPAVTVSMMISRNMDAGTGARYIVVQFLGGLCGMLMSHLMFIGQDFYMLVTVSEISRGGGAYLAEFIGTFVLVLVIYGCVHRKSTRPGPVIGFLVGGFLITTSSTMFANPQVTFARVFTFAIAGIRPIDAAGFMAFELIGAVAATFFARFMFPSIWAGKFKSEDRAR
jgi:glycerol uptake facilitator-like aquaporin